MPTRLDHVKARTGLIAETAAVTALRRFQPDDGWVTPDLMLASVHDPVTAELIEEALLWGRSRHGVTSRVADRMLVACAEALSRIVPGRVTVEVDADLCFDADGMAMRARGFMDEFERRRVGRDKVLIGIPATWEGIEAARLLQAEGIDCTLSQVFSLAQAAAAADAGAFMISMRLDGDAGGIEFVRSVARYVGAHDLGCVLAASGFGTSDDIAALADVARLGFGIDWLERLATDETALPQVKPPRHEGVAARMILDEKSFRFILNQDGVAADRLAAALRGAVAELARFRNFASGKLEDAVDPLAARLSQDMG
ncbi:MAG TPA: transaldolase family protein [Lichenihabitans sp.]|jgi:transaldolase|nr:transaldolase family protein [Lichenihabitans sp.]